MFGISGLITGSSISPQMKEFSSRWSLRKLFEEKLCSNLVNMDLSPFRHSGCRKRSQRPRAKEWMRRMSDRQTDRQGSASLMIKCITAISLITCSAQLVRILHYILRADAEGFNILVDLCSLFLIVTN
jgi:hypothetical protein